MNLGDVFQTELIQIGCAAPDKQGVLQEIARLARRSDALDAVPEKALVEALAAREKIGSTGFGNGIAIPHCALDQVDTLVVGLLIVPEGIDFKALDGEKTYLVFFIIGPRAERNRHIQLLSGISKMLTSSLLVGRLQEASGPDQALELLREITGPQEAGPPETAGRGSCLFHVFIQREELFEDILQVFSSLVQGSIAVIENKSVGSYLNRLPLFAAYWNESQQGFGRIILAIVDKGLCNDVIRRINLVSDTPELDPGILISVQDLLYSSGSLEL